jgi:hypothetical protein
MIIRTALAVSLLALAACQPAAAPTPDAAQPAGAEAQSAASGCAASAELAWPAELTASAVTTGPTCEKAAVLLVVRNDEQDPLLVWSSPTSDVFSLYDRADAAAMTAGLKEWLDQSSNSMPSSSKLPEWKTGAEAPGDPASEFPFHVSEWLDRDTYEALRAEDLVTFMFPQGRESAVVYAYRDLQLDEVGIQQFPG